MKVVDRLASILPGFLTWTVLLSPFLLSFHYPALIVSFVIVFDTYWLFRSIRLARNTIIAYRYMKRDQAIDWSLKLASGPPKQKDGVDLVASKFGPDELTHLILLIHYKESGDLLAHSIQSYVESNFPKSRFWLILASEERAKETAIPIFNNLKRVFGQHFAVFKQTLHPDGLPGEIRSKSSNATWAGKRIKELLEAEGLDFSQVVIHNFDADTRVYPQYFDYVSYQYLTTVLGQPTSFQPIHLYSNNIWDTPAVMRIIAQSSTIIFMHNTLRSHRFHHFSSRSDIFQTIVDINYWTVDAIPEDSRQFFDSFFRYQGKLVVQPLYIPLRMDAVLAQNYWSTFKNQYRQLRRWAWGVSDFPYLIKRSIQDRQVSWAKKLVRIIYLLESHLSWATGSIIVSFVGWIPIILNRNFANTVIGYNFPSITRLILGMALVGLIVVIALSYLLLPPRPPHRPKAYYLNFLWQWLLVPVVSILISSVAAIDAQTRLMFGKYLEYQVTEKKSVGFTGRDARQY